jgi:hypothetical protein
MGRPKKVITEEMVECHGRLVKEYKELLRKHNMLRERYSALFQFVQLIKVEAS